MHRIIRGGICLAVLLFISLISKAQIRLVSSKDGKPVKDAIVHFSGNSKEQKTVFSDETGTAPFPSFSVFMVAVFATGYQPVYDTLQGLTHKDYLLVPLKVQMDEVVITGQYRPNEITNSVYDVTVFDQKNIELKAANNLGDLLQYENSILISNDPFLGSGININGVSGNNVKILQDGVPVIGRENGNIDISQLDLSNVERVEMVRGPMSETYGSDALAGVINLISKKKKTDGIDAGCKLYYESNGTYNINVNAGIRKKKHELTLNLGRNFFDGYSEYDTLRSQVWKPKEQYLADLGYAYRFKNGYIRYQAGISREKLISKGNIIATPYEAYAFDDYYYTLRMSHKLFVEKELKNHTSLDFTNAFSNYERSRESYMKNMVSLEDTGLAANNYTNSFRQYLFRGTYSTYKAWKKINYQAGYEITLDEASGERTGNSAKHINDYALFGSSEITLIKKMVIRPAIRIIYNSKYPAPVVPSLHIKYDPSKLLTIRGSVARGFRAPSVKELYLDFYVPPHSIKGNPDLMPELSDYAQLSFDFHKKIKKVDISVQPDVFYNHIYHRITLAQINSNALEYTYFNMDDFRNMGGNFNLSLSTGGITLSSGVNLTAYHNGLEDMGGLPAYNETVNLNGSVSYSIPKAGLSTGLFFKHFGKVTGYSIEGETVSTYHINDYNILDFTLSKSFFKKSITISSGLKNIFNITTTKGGPNDGDFHSGGDNQALIGMGRYYFVGVQFKFEKN